MASQVSPLESLNSEVTSHSSLHEWDNDACADFAYEGCGLPQYTASFQRNLNGKELLALNPRKLAQIGVRSLPHQQQILGKIRSLAELGSYPHKSHHLSLRQQLSGALHHHKVHHTSENSASAEEEEAKKVPNAMGGTLPFSPIKTHSTIKTQATADPRPDSGGATEAGSKRTFSLSHSVYATEGATEAEKPPPYQHFREVGVYAESV
jgi:hypothetical protein